MISAILLSNCHKPSDDPTIKTIPIDTHVVTTTERTIAPLPVPHTSPAIFPYEIAKFKDHGYGLWTFGPGLDYVKRFDLMPPGYGENPPIPKATLLNFFTISDAHIMDKETPAQAIHFGYKGNNPSAYSATMLLTTQVLDSAVQTINALHQRQPFDFGMTLGDSTNSNQYNELRWFVDVMDGNIINPDSGAKDDPVPGLNNDYQDKFKAVGLDKAIPWYPVLGNHDHLWLGSYPTNDYLRPCYTGDNILNMGDIFKDPRGIESRGFYGGAVDGSTLYGEIIGAGAVGDFPNPPKVRAADSSRRSISKEDWKNEFQKSTTLPAGHGVNSQSNLLGCYTFEPKADLPLKVIVLDDTQPPTDFDIHEHGYINNERYAWLSSELDKGESEGKLMIIAAHIPLFLIGYNAHSPIPASTIIKKLHACPNFIMWMSGHIHRNKVTAFKSPEANKPELGFWHVETSSLRDFPQQFRTIKIVRNSDNTISIIVVNIDPALKEGSIAFNSRTYAIATMQILKLPMENPSYNAELVVPLSPRMQSKIQGLGIAIKSDIDNIPQSRN